MLGYSLRFYRACLVDNNFIFILVVTGVHSDRFCFVLSGAIYLKRLDCFMNRRRVCRDRWFNIILTRSSGVSSVFRVLFLAIFLFGQAKRKWSRVSLMSCSWELQSQ